MAIPGDHNLDANQVIQNVYEEDNNALRVNTQATIVSGAFEVAIDQANDSIKVGDGTDLLEVNPDGSINVNASIDFPGEIKTFYNEVTSIGASTLTTIQSITILSNTDFLQKIEVSGTNIAEYRVSINNVVIAKKRTYFGSSLNLDFDFVSSGKGLPLNILDVVDIKVIHLRPSAGDFNSRIQIYET